MFEQDVFNDIISKVLAHNLNQTGQIGHVEHRPTEDEKLEEYDDIMFNSIPQMESLMSDDVGVEHTIYLMFSDICVSKYNDIFELTDKLELCKSVSSVINECITNKITDQKMSKVDINVVTACYNTKQITTLQAVLTIYSNDVKYVTKTSHQLSDIFSKAGLIIIREKITTNIDKTDGIPKNIEELSKSKSDRYILIKTKLGNVSLDDAKQKTIKYESFYNTSVVLCKIFDVYYIYHFIKKTTDHNEKISLSYQFTQDEAIKEYVWYDTYQQADNELLENKKHDSEEPINKTKDNMYELLKTNSTMLMIAGTVGLIAGFLIMRKR